MRNIQGIHLKGESNEELIPDYSPDFLYSVYCAELDEYIGKTVPWHWHRTLELFYMESGVLEYTTPGGKWVFPAGSGGLINSNVLHTTRVISSDQAAIQMLHQFEPEFLSGERGNRMDLKYVRPLTEVVNLEVIPLFRGDPVQEQILKKIAAACRFKEEQWGYEFAIRQRLVEIWLQLVDIVSLNAQPPEDRKTDALIKGMMLYVQEHYREVIRVEQLANAVHISKRVCYRLFRQKLHMSPLEYITEFRLRCACRMLSQSDCSVTETAHACGFGSASYFDKVFLESLRCTPVQYREDWHNRAKNQRK